MSARKRNMIRKALALVDSTNLQTISRLSNMEQQIARRAKEYAKSLFPDMREEELPSFSDSRRDYAHGAREQHKIDIEKLKEVMNRLMLDTRDKAEIIKAMEE